MDSKTKKIIIGAIVVITVAVIGAMVVRVAKKQNNPQPQKEPSKQEIQATQQGLTEEEVEQQLQKLDEIRSGDKTQPSEEDVQNQLEELDAQRGTQQPLTEQEVQDQLDALDQMRKQ